MLIDVLCLALGLLRVDLSSEPLIFTFRLFRKMTCTTCVLQCFVSKQIAYSCTGKHDRSIFFRCGTAASARSLFPSDGNVPSRAPLKCPSVSNNFPHSSGEIESVRIVERHNCYFFRLLDDLSRCVVSAWLRENTARVWCAARLPSASTSACRHVCPAKHSSDETRLSSV